MGDMRKLCELGASKMMEMDRKRWCKAFFQTHSKCDSPDNNMTETFNSWVLGARCKAIVSMNEEIMENLIGRFRDKKLTVAKWDSEVAPRIRVKMNERIELARHCKVVWDGEDSFRFSDHQIDRIHVVDWLEGTCTCGYWKLSGIPCQHVASTVHDRGKKVEYFVSDYYKKENYLAAYITSMDCTRGHEMWADYDAEKPEPPIMKRRPVRPRVNRVKPKCGEIKKAKVRGATIETLSRHGRVMHCSGCGKGHNKSGCLDKEANNTSSATQNAKTTASKTKKGSKGKEASTSTKGTTGNNSATITNQGSKATEGTTSAKRTKAKKSNEPSNDKGIKRKKPTDSTQPANITKKTKKPWK